MSRPSLSDQSQRTRILKISAQLFAQRGYHAVSMSELQDAIGLGRGALYHHIRSKEDLLYDISREYIVDLAESAARMRREIPDPRDRVVALSNYLVEEIHEHQAELTVCFREVHGLTELRHAEVLRVHTTYERIWRDTLTQGAELGAFRPFDGIVFKAILGMHYYSYLWVRPAAKSNRAQIKERLIDLTLRMLAPTAE